MRKLKLEKYSLFLVLFFIFFTGCSKKELKLEEKKIVKDIDSTEKNYSGKKEKVSLGEPLEPKFSDGTGRVNPFIQPSEVGGAPAGGIPIAPGNVSAPSQFPPKIPAQLPPLPQQEEEEVPTLEVPKWPTQASILAAGPRSNIASMFNLKLTGIVYDTQGRKKYAIIQETLQTSTGTTGATGGINYRSYVVREGEVITDYKIKVKEITPNRVTLTRGNQRIDLALVEIPKPLLLPTFGKIQASEVR